MSGTPQQIDPLESRFSGRHTGFRKELKRQARRLRRRREKQGKFDPKAGYTGWSI